MPSLRRLSALCVLALSFLAVPALAEGPARLAHDFASGSDAGDLSLSNAATLGNRVVFLRDGTEHQPMLWVTDGTPDGTRALATPCPACDATSLLGSTGSVAFYRTINRRIPNLPNADMEIWRTDGTPAGTFLLMAGTGPDDPALSSIDGGLLFFVACTPEQGCEVWLSDGTVAGTRPAGEIVPGPGTGDIRQIVSAGGRGGIGGRAFVVSGSSLWAADRSGVRRLRDTSEIGYLSAGRGRAFFVAEVGGESEIWTSDGTAAGTRAVTSFGPKNPFESFPFPQLVGDRFYFAARADNGTDLWSVGEKPASLRRLTDFHDVTMYFDSIARSGNRVLFVAYRPGPTEPALWVSTGDIRSTAPLTGSPEVQSGLASVGRGRFVFKGNNRSGEALWVTDGTLAGTRLLKHTGRHHRLVQYATLGDRVLFQVANEHETGELWLTDGTPAGTFFLATGGRGSPQYPGWERPLFAARANRTVLFSGYPPGEDEPYELLMASDGSPGGLRELDRFTTGSTSYPRFLVAIGDRLLLQTCGETQQMRALHGTDATDLLFRLHYSPCGDSLLSSRVATAGGRAAFILPGFGEGNSLWGTDGTQAGSAMLIPAIRPSEASDVASFGSGFVVSVSVYSTGGPFRSQLWVSDGTPAGTGKLLDLPDNTVAHGFTSAGNRLYFFDTEMIAANTFRVRPWVSDGTTAGTHRLVTLNGTSPWATFTEVAGRLFFSFTPEGGPTEIWSTDGTPDGTGPAVTADSGMLDPEMLAGAGGRLYFQARRAGKPAEAENPLLPWVSDGTDAGTARLADAEIENVEDYDYYLPDSLPGARKSFGFVEAGGRVYFRASDPAHGDELWSTDGTPEGTALVKDIAPGPLGSSPQGLVAWNGRLWFRARNIPQGMELWTSDGTAKGTRLVQDISEGPSWSTPRELTAVGDRLYFSANDGEHGREVWVLQASDVPLEYP
ncbi:MAG TPA: ELWxxDGT repeat protein [Thermoanaerobaculia bacterium]|jgi:ELWxxDGT repeat protein|nr:ELWxxDGT repeat protein [Thermoanaerobaculia bacterium]